MPFSRRSAFKLSLAISTVLLSQASVAASAENTGWNCTRTANGQWDCSAGPSTAPQPAAPAVPESTAPTAAPAAQPAQPEGSPAPSTTPTQVTRPAATETPAAPAPEPATTTQAPPAAATSGTSGTPVQSGASAQSTPTESLTPGEKDNPYARLDWYPYPSGQQPGICRGRYIEPPLNTKDSGTPFNLQPVIIAATTSKSELGGLTQLEGGVKLSQGGRQLSSEYAEYDQVTQQVRLEGDVRYREKGLLMVSDAAQTKLSNLETIFSKSEYVLHQQHARGEAKRILRLEDGRIRIENGSYTQCEPGNTSWQVAADSITLNPMTGFGEARGATLEVLDTPVLYMPYFYFPIDNRRISGFLYPSITYSSSEGLDLAVPYYFNLAPNYDDTLTPRLISNRGLMFENEFRYMNSWSQNVLSNAFMPNDSKANKHRWLLGVDHEGTPWKNWQSRIDYTAVSDRDYFSDLKPTDLQVNYESQLNRLGELRYDDLNLTFIARAHSYQSLNHDDKPPYRRLPQFLVEGRVPDLPAGLSAGYQAEYVHFDLPLNDPLLTDPADRVTGQRVHIQPSVELPLETSWGYLKPKLSVWSTRYKLDHQQAGLDDSPSVDTTITSLDSGLIFERPTQFGNNHYTQTLEPRLFYLYVPEVDQNDIPAFDTAALDFRYDTLFRENRFSGRDRIGDANQLSLGLATRFYDDRGLERFSVALGQAHYFADRKVQLEPGDPVETDKESNFATAVKWALTPDLTISHDGELDHNNLSAVAQNYRVTFSPNDQRLVYASYRESNGDSSSLRQRRQSDVAVRWPLDPQWNALARWRYDLIDNENLDALLGLEYKDCCWKVRFGLRQWSKDDNGTRKTDRAVLLQFVLRGLGSVGGKDTNSFIRDITGFDEGKNEEF